MLILFLIIAFWGVLAEKSVRIRLKTKESDAFRVIFQELVEKIPQLQKEKYSNILRQFLGPQEPSENQIWCADVPLDQSTKAKFECKLWGNFKGCTLKAVNGEAFDGDVQFYFYEGSRVEIYLRSLYVADHIPLISGRLIVNLAKKMADSEPGAVATLNDASNVKTLALLTTGRSYYEHLGFHYVNSDGTKMTKKRENFQKMEMDADALLFCISQKLDERMPLRKGFTFQRVRRESIKQGILGALRAELGRIRLLEDFWGIYRKAMKSADFAILRREFNFKTYIFTRHLRECLLAQIKIDEEIFGFSDFGGMSYP